MLGSTMCQICLSHFWQYVQQYVPNECAGKVHLKCMLGACAGNRRRQGVPVPHQGCAPKTCAGNVRRNCAPKLCAENMRRKDAPQMCAEIVRRKCAPKTCAENVHRIVRRIVLRIVRRIVHRIVLRIAKQYRNPSVYTNLHLPQGANLKDILHNWGHDLVCAEICAEMFAQ
jgi:hypothetical protein